ncbi:chaperone modulator CbpM [Flavobacterium sp. J27]|uniref:chaperone modulator CbpM n=1 Tax=Flavobacterium sp. J27 TaxID=2060419 RepID=UPI001031A7F0|nr:chaperone modulator CbpM [Flavobacterium sp. J27]
MNTQELIIIEVFCKECQIEPHLIDDLEDFGLIQTVVYENNKYLHREELVYIEKVIRLHNELHINKEGIEVVLDLLQKMDQLSAEVKHLKTRLGLYE